MVVTALLNLLAACAPFATGAPVDCGWSASCFAHNFFAPEPTTPLGCEARYASNDDVTLKKKTWCYHKVQLADDEAKGKKRDADVEACHVLHQRVVLPWLRDRCNELCDKHYLGKEAHKQFVCDDARRSAMNHSLGSYYVCWICILLGLSLVDVPAEYVGVLAVVPVIVFVGLNQQIMDKFF